MGGQGLDVFEVMGTDKPVSLHSLLVNSWITNFLKGCQRKINKSNCYNLSANMLKGLGNFSYE